MSDQNASRNEALVALAELVWPGRGFVLEAGRSGRLAVLFAMSLSAAVGHSYVGGEHLIAGGLRAGAVADDEVAEDLRRLAVAGVADSLRLAQVQPEQVHAWFADGRLDDPAEALRGLGPLPTVTPRAQSAMRRARVHAAGGAAGAVHVVAGVLEDPGVVATVAYHHGLSLDAARAWVARRTAWGPLLDLVHEAES